MTDGEEENEGELLLDTPLEEEEGEEQEGAEAQAEEDPEEFAIEIEGEAADEEHPNIRRQREHITALERDNAALRAQIAKPVKDIGPKPTLESCGYDEDKFEADLTAWHEHNREKEKAEQAEKERIDARDAKFAAKYADFKAQGKALGIKDFDEAEKAVGSALPRELGVAIVTYMEKPAQVIAALHRYPSQLDKIAEVAKTDMGLALVMVTRLETKVKTSTRKGPPPAEASTIQRSTAPLSQKDPNKELEKMEKEWEKKGGSRDHIIAYKRKMNQKGKAA